MRAVLLSAICVCCSCNRARPPDLPYNRDDAVEMAARAVDQLQWYADAYGGVTMSSPLLVQPDDTFKFNLSMTADQYFAAERDQISGREAGSVASALTLGANFSGSTDVVAMQQYAQAVADYRHDRAIAGAKQQILNDAAYRQYYAAMVSASQISDKAARASAEADAAKQYAAALSGPAADATLTPPASPAAPAAPSISMPTNAAASLLPAIAPAQGLYASGTPGVTGETRTATLMAAGDVATSAMLSALLDPSKLSAFAGRQVLWGVSMVSVNPGWKTRIGYSATLEGHVDYTWRWARPEVRDAFISQAPKSPIEAKALGELQRCVVDSLPVPHPNSYPEAVDNALSPPFDETAYASWTYRGPSPTEPVVAAASPMGDAQALDLQSSTRSIRQTALQMAYALSGAGYGAQAAAFIKFAKTSQDDLETRTNNIVVSAYSSNGGDFGFQFNPRVVANPKSGAGSQAMQVPTFPTLLVIGLTNNETHARVLVVGSNCFVVEPQLHFQTAVRWTRTDAQCQHRFDEVTPCKGRELTEEEIYVAATRAHNAVKAVKENAKKQKLSTSGIDRLWYRESNLANSFGSDQGLWMPPDVVVPGPDKPKKASVTIAAPTSVDLQYGENGTLTTIPVTMTVAGSNLDLVDTSGVKGVDGVTASANKNGTIDLKFTVSKPGIYVFMLPLKDGTALATPPFTVRAPNVFVVSHANSKKDGVETDTLTATPGTPPEVIKSEIEKKKMCPADMKVEVDTHTSTKGAAK